MVWNTTESTHFMRSEPQEAQMRFSRRDQYPKHYRALKRRRDLAKLSPPKPKTITNALEFNLPIHTVGFASVTSRDTSNIKLSCVSHTSASCSRHSSHLATKCDDRLSAGRASSQKSCFLSPRCFASLNFPFQRPNAMPSMIRRGKCSVLKIASATALTRPYRAYIK